MVSLPEELQAREAAARRRVDELQADVAELTRRLEEAREDLPRLEITIQPTNGSCLRHLVEKH
ncbi:hypothetical protein [Streptomyces sp. VRA16 Mangrove soil]|uniref:hypothetical protein n=1 Tax=Streptomyces sp. VRA16 Mangrove soil TaxID=2817434 RepID=UPI001A9E1EF3|nr:hypothetical protein [Streptomyces sp. VRA16 Mangrove soil]MBO1332623.1 hypothetical protein [Streptomyces sp. VRA16 Mangrove soil]